MAWSDPLMFAVALALCKNITATLRMLSDGWCSFHALFSALSSIPRRALHCPYRVFANIVLPFMAHLMPFTSVHLTCNYHLLS